MAKPIFPVERLVIKRTGSMGSQLGTGRYDDMLALHILFGQRGFHAFDNLFGLGQTALAFVATGQLSLSRFDNVVAETL